MELPIIHGQVIEKVCFYGFTTPWERLFSPHLSLFTAIPLFYYQCRIPFDIGYYYYYYYFTGSFYSL